MSVLPLASRALALVSPVPISDAMAREIETFGDVRYLIAPNLLHHSYLGAAIERYPDARVLAPSGLRAKRPDLRIDGSLDDDLPPEIAAAVDVVHIDGAPALEEHIFFHRAARTLVATELVFNVVRPRGVTAHVVLFAVGCHGRLAQSRAWRFLVKDRPAAARSIEEVLSLPVSTLVVAHGDIVRTDAHARLAEALRWLRPNRRALQTAPR
jgi:hypothetical protein